MLKIGLTGGIGSGKSTVARIFEILGVPVYYADAEAKRLMNTTESLKEGMIRIFGPEAVVNGEINRSFIASKAFNDASLLSTLNALVHPAVHDDFKSWCRERQDEPYIIEEAAILVESGALKLFNFLIVVYADEAVRIQRVHDRDGTSFDAIRSRMEHQMPAEELNRYADYIINNNGDQLLIPQVLDLDKKFVSLQFS